MFIIDRLTLVNVQLVMYSVNYLVFFLDVRLINRRRAQGISLSQYWGSNVYSSSVLHVSTNPVYLIEGTSSASLTALELSHASSVLLSFFCMSYFVLAQKLQQPQLNQEGITNEIYIVNIAVIPRLGQLCW